MAKVNCVDLSSWQSGINFKSIKNAGIEAVIIRVGFGNYTKDSQFENHYKGAKEAGLKIGAYWYSKAWTTADAKAEALDCVSLLNGKKLDLPIYFDMEEDQHCASRLGKDTLTKMTEAFCDTVISKGYKGGVYSNWTGFTYDLDYKKLKSKYSIWFAYYNPSPYYDCDVWQNSSTGKVNGISGNVDTNVILNTALLGSISTPSTSTNTTNVSNSKNPSIKYRVRAGGKWYSEITDLKDYAGVKGKPITDIAVKATEGTVKYRVHIKGGSWLPYVTGYNINDDNNGYAGDHKPIDKIEIYYSTPSSVVKRSGYLRAKYRVSPVNKDYYDWQYDNETSNGQDGYAGSYGINLDKLQITLSK